jgi:CheY-like chemotaxis protein
MDITSATIDVGSESSSDGPSFGHSAPVAIRELLDAIPLPLAIVDDNLRCVELNRRMAATLGSSGEKLRGLPIREIVPAFAAELETQFLRVLAGDIVEDSVLRDGSEHAAVGRGEKHSFAALRNACGAPAGVLWVAPREERPTIPSARSVPGLQRWRILMAEDLAMNQEIIAEMLESAGYEVVTVADGASAIDSVRRGSFDLILMDIEMPLMGGLEATRAIRALGEAGAVPIVAMTANRGPEQLAACRAAGMDAYICKPVDQADLLSTMRKWLKSSHKVQPERQAGQDNTIDFGVLENIRAHFGPFRTQRFIREVCIRLEHVLLQLSPEADSKHLGDDLHSLVSMGGHLGLRELSERARAFMVALRKQTGNLEIVTEEFRRSALRALAALQQVDAGAHPGSRRS